MGRYLDRLKTDFSEKPAGMLLTELTKAPSVGSVSTACNRLSESCIAENDASDETRVRAWLTRIGETDPDTIAEVLSYCRRDPEARAYFLRRASGTET